MILSDVFLKDDFNEESGSISDRFRLTSDSKDPKSVKVRRIPGSYSDFQFEVRKDLNASMSPCAKDANEL